MSLRFSEEDFSAYQKRMGQWGNANQKANPKPFDNSVTVMPTEDQDQRTVAQFLDLMGFCWAHIPNEGKRKQKTGARLKASGMKKGCPDILIFDPPPDSDWTGVAIELKRQKGGRLSEEQREWLELLSDRGWLTRCICGADEAIKFLREVYGK